jgi:hypothetical protein
LRFPWQKSGRNPLGYCIILSFSLDVWKGAKYNWKKVEPIRICSFQESKDSLMDEHLHYPKLQTAAYSNLLLKLCHRARNSQEATIIFDLSKTEFITPLAIIILAGSISECINLQKKAKYKRPDNHKTREFLAGIGFNKFFKIPGDEHKIESPNVQLKRLFGIDYMLTEQIVEVFGKSIQMSEGVKDSLVMSLNELMTNVFDHSESQRGCYVCAQSYRRARTIRLSIADFGIGIQSSLRKVPAYQHLASDYDSIVLAVQQGVSSRIDKDAGYGLTHINRFIRVNEGRMTVLSGSGKVSWNFTGKKKRSELKQVMNFPFQGTIINLEINAAKEGLYFLKSEEANIF